MHLENTDTRTHYNFIETAYQNALVYREQYKTLSVLVDGILNSMSWPKDKVVYRTRTWNNPLLGPRFEVDRMESSQTHGTAFASVALHVGEGSKKQEILAHIELVLSPTSRKAMIRCSEKEQGFDLDPSKPIPLKEITSFLFDCIVVTLDKLAMSEIST